MTETRLDEFTKDEWFDVVRELKPGITREEYTVMWDEFQETKEAHLAKRSVQ